MVVPAILGVGGLFGWAIKSRTEELRAAQERLAGERRKLYAALLDPYVKVFASTKDPALVKDAEKQLISVDYRRTALEVVLIGDDNVVDAYNVLMQHFFKQGASAEDTFKPMRLYGVLLLAIRKSLGNAATKLDEYDMLTHMITDIDDVLREKGIQRTRALRQQRHPRPQEHA